MLYYASLFFIIAVIGLLVVVFAKLLSGVGLLITEICIVIFLVLFVGCIIIDRMKKRRQK